VNAGSRTLLLDGAAGAIEVAVDAPAAGAILLQGVAVLAHPHPLFGGSMQNKVVTTLARAAASAGSFDEGRGEAQDFAQVCRWAFAEAPGMRVLGGFSFGAFVAAQAHGALAAEHDIAKLLLFGTATSRFAVPQVPAHSLIVHGESDDVVPLASVLDWARPAGHPVVVLPGAGHFFDGRLGQVKSLTVNFLLAPLLPG
jgi:uncharacterized protein